MELLDDYLSPSSSLEETFYLISKKNTVYRVKLSEKGLCLQKDCNGNIKTQTIVLEDVIGCRCMRSKRFAQKCKWRPRSNKKNVHEEVDESSIDWDESDISAYLYIYAYVLKKGKMTGHKKRERMVITLRFRSYDRYDDNMREAQKWKATIKYLMNSLKKTSTPSCFYQSSDIKMGKVFPRFWHIVNNFLAFTCRNVSSLTFLAVFDNVYVLILDNKILVIINPKSGVGKAREIFQNKVVPLFTEADINYDLHCTRHAKDAQNLVRTKVRI